MDLKSQLGKEIEIDGEKYTIQSFGVEREDGMIYAHLASTTKFREQKNGKVPVQICDFFTPKALGIESAPRMMRLPKNSNHTGYVGEHAENDWCAKAGCIPICRGESE